MLYKEMHVGKISHKKNHYLNEEVGYLHNSLHSNLGILNPCPNIGFIMVLMGQTQLISSGEMSLGRELENKKCENGVTLDGFHHMKLEKYIENCHICMYFFQRVTMNVKGSYMNYSSNLVYSQI
jgi:hypothetical protein